MHTELKSAIEEIEAFEGRAEEFRLMLANQLLDPFGINSAIIMDKVLSRGWWPDGFEEREGVRIFRYKAG